MTAIKKLFYARTSDTSMFGTEKTGRVRFLDKKLIPQETPREIKEELFKHRYIDIKNIDWIRLYFARVLGCFCPRFMFKKRDQFLKMYERGQGRIESELNIVKIMKSVRNMKILMRHSFMDDEIKYQISHSKKNLINIDTTSSESGGDIDNDG